MAIKEGPEREDTRHPLLSPDFESQLEAARLQRAIVLAQRAKEGSRRRLEATSARFPVIIEQRTQSEQQFDHKQLPLPTSLHDKLVGQTVLDEGVERLENTKKRGMSGVASEPRPSVRLVLLSSMATFVLAFPAGVFFGQMEFNADSQVVNAPLAIGQDKAVPDQVGTVRAGTTVAPTLWAHAEQMHAIGVDTPPTVPTAGSDRPQGLQSGAPHLMGLPQNTTSWSLPIPPALIAAATVNTLQNAEQTDIIAGTTMPLGSVVVDDDSQTSQLPRLEEAGSAKETDADLATDAPERISVLSGIRPIRSPARLGAGLDKTTDEANSTQQVERAVALRAQTDAVAFQPGKELVETAKIDDRTCPDCVTPAAPFLAQAVVLVLQDGEPAADTASLRETLVDLGFGTISEEFSALTVAENQVRFFHSTDQAAAMALAQATQAQLVDVTWLSSTPRVGTLELRLKGNVALENG